MSIPLHIQESLRYFVKNTKQPELIATYLRYIEEKFRLEPVLFVKDKIVFRSDEKAIQILEEEDRLWRETEIKIGYVKSSVDDNTTKIYICPFTGKVFGNNTHPNPQDAIYEWVAKCPENKERQGGLKAKRFFISDDKEVIRSYANKCAPKNPVTKVVYSSAINGKLFHSKEAVIEDARENYLKRVSLVEVLNQSKFQIETSFMQMIEEELGEEKIALFLEALTDIPGLQEHVESWLGEVEQE
ncbi:MAG: DUF2709 domain-containing protein [Chlamydia sp.]